MNLNRCFQFFSVFLLQLYMADFTQAVTNIPTDQTALQLLKKYITLDPYSSLDNWNYSASVCNWKGVTCGRDHRRVIALDLSSMNLAGVIPKEIGNLIMLKKLNLEHNNFEGVLPDEIGSLNKMENISISNNHITGSIPRSIGNCTSLKEINFSGNNLTGTIPPEIGALRHLEIFRIRDNLLTGIPSALFNISTLKVISAQSNHLSGHLPSTLGLLLPNLEELFLGGNELVGTLSPFISNASKLTTLDLSYNSFSGTFPAALGNLRLLQVLNLANNSMAGESSTPESSFLSSLTNCNHLRKLMLSGNVLNDTLASIGNFSTNLEEFSANNCSQKGNIPSEIGNLTNLISLSLGNNELTGNIPTDIGRLRKLQGLHLQGNHLQGTIPVDLCSLGSLIELYLSGNELVGSIPECLGDLTTLVRIDLSSNNLTSAIPLTLWSNSYLLSINISSNFLKGSLPRTTEFRATEVIDLSNNLLSGELPSSLGESLVFLSLANNGLSGSIDNSTLEASKNLESLDLSCNNISGKIPEPFTEFKFLRYFNVSFNGLEGEIPDEGPFTNFSAQSYMMNKALCGAQRLLVPPCKSSVVVSRFHRRVPVIVVIVPVTVVITLLTILFIYLRWTRIKKSEQVWARTNNSAVKRFSFLELKRATDAFSEGNLIGHGSFSSVYRGILQDGKVVAIKVFNVEEETSLSSFEVERKIMHNASHRNLIRILFSFSNTKFKALVTEYMSNGTLEKWLHTHNYHLDILRRLDIMIDTVSAVKYLHYDYCPVVHCDLKPSNILLDEDMIAHVSDFGSAKLLDPKLHGSTRHSTVMYTIGYVAPEYGFYGAVSTKTDLYSFGILLMETFTGKKPTSEMFYGEMSLRRWVAESFPSEVDKVIDRSLLETREGHVDAKIECITYIMRLALCCSSESPLERPDMKEVEFMLNRIKDELIKNISRD